MCLEQSLDGCERGSENSEWEADRQVFCADHFLFCFLSPKFFVLLCFVFFSPSVPHAGSRGCFFATASFFGCDVVSQLVSLFLVGAFVSRQRRQFSSAVLVNGVVSCRRPCFSSAALFLVGGIVAHQCRRFSSGCLSAPSLIIGGGVSCQRRYFSSAALFLFGGVFSRQ